MNDFASYAARLTERTPALVPTQIADTILSREILAADLFDGKSGEYVEACRAGLLLFNDDLDAAHRIVQNPETQTNNFWHAILHRREGDFSNARYWWHRTGTHPAFDEIYDVVLHRVNDFPLSDDLRIAREWEPLAFNSLCEAAARTGEWEEQLREVQRLEMKMLLEWCASRVK